MPRQHNSFPSDPGTVPVRHPFLRIAGQSAWYFIGNVLVKASGFILLPIYTKDRYLRISDYGVWGQLEIAIQIAVAVFGLQITYALLRFHSDEKERDRT